jgi:putative nucleotidyltransferase with HDIG domain
LNKANSGYLEKDVYESKEALTTKVKDKERILIVDDDEAIRNLFKETLEELGYRCESVENGLECLQKVYEGNSYDIVLLDVHMPRLNGIETLRKLKIHSPDISIIIVSASREIENVRVALKEGAYDYIFKPFNVQEIETVIRRAVERAKLIKENRDYQQNLEKKVVEQTKELVGLYANTLEALVLALDLREHETGYHSYRVTEYALTLARCLEPSSLDLSALAKGALLHDIGKIGVPDNILLKPEELTEEEWQIMKKHPIFGYKLLKKIHFLEEASEIVLNHHERYDGQGYPQGISGDDIPVGARIFSIVDALDAMTSTRIYRKAIPIDKAIERIAEASGSQFDPVIVDAFLKIPDDEWIRIRNRIESSGSEYLKKLLYRLSKAG